MTNKAIMNANQFAADIVSSANQKNADMIAEAMLDGLNRATLDVEAYEALKATFSEPMTSEPLTISDYMMGVAITLVSCVENLAEKLDEIEQPETVVFEALGGISKNILQREK